MSSNSHLTWALNQEGELVHVDDVPNGNECGCICPHCKSALCAKNGGDEDKRIHHFAHLSGADCVGAIESALHLMAKEILLETKCVYLPNRLDGRKGELIHFDCVEVEFYDKDTQLRPDCIGYYDEKCLWIEFKRTHAVDTKKRGKIISAHIDCIEIDLNGCPLDPIAVKDFITSSAENRKWIRDISVSNQRAGYSSGSGYCDRYDDYNDKYRRVIRTFAKDEKGRLINLQDDTFDMNEHVYYCLACGKELTIDVDEDGINRFIHVEGNAYCKDELYLHEAAKEILYERFQNSDDFVIRVPQHHTCDESLQCHLYNEKKCRKIKNSLYNLKKYGYVECLKNIEIPNTPFKCDLVVKRKDSFDEAIIVNIDTGNKPQDFTSVENKIIDLGIRDENTLKNLKDRPIGESGASMINFKEQSPKTIPGNDINREVERFQLFSNGSYYMGKASCSDVKNRYEASTYGITYEIMFADDELDVDDKRMYSLIKCYNKKMRVCYCEICFFCTNSHGMSGAICKRYKTKGTPQHPLQTMPVDCPHFSLNRHLVSKNGKEFQDIDIKEWSPEPQKRIRRF